MVRSTLNKETRVGEALGKPRASAGLRTHRLKRQLPLLLMLLPGLALVAVFEYVPMAGIVIAFQQYIPARGLFGSQEWIGFENFQFVFRLPSTAQVVRNTLTISAAKILLGLAVPVVFSLLLNEVQRTGVRRTLQTAVYFPHFLSWVLLGGILIDILSPTSGIVNRVLTAVGAEPIFFLGSNKWFQPTVVASHIWKEFGFGTVIYMAAISGIDVQLYEAVRVDGGNRLHAIRHVTLPGLRMTIVLLAVLSLGQVLRAGFDQIVNLYSPIVYETGDIIDTFVYRVGLLQGQFGIAAAVGLFQSFVSFFLISTSYFFAYRFAGYRIF